MWIYHRQIHRKSTNASWVGEDESPTIIVRRDHNYYIENCLKPVVKEIWKQRKSAGTKGVKLLQDNARPHIHSDVINYFTEEGIIIMSHPPYSSDLAPCDYWLNDYIKRNLNDQPDEKSLARAVSKYNLQFDLMSLFLSIRLGSDIRLFKRSVLLRHNLLHAYILLDKYS
ncbi:unnamed protein product, partial [Rotaria sp. Silwood2]